jgi:prepilin-type N-terminal cleavage/methylation domain-containing protein
MKMPIRFRSTKSSGFTLVELLVVIGIIAILASVLAVSAGSVINSAKRAKAASTASQIQTAVLGYYTEYGAYPIPASQVETPPKDYEIKDSDEADWADLICALSGNINPSNGKVPTLPVTVTNTRSIAFLNLKNSDVDSNGCPKNPVPAGNGSAATSQYFNIAVDTDYDGVLGVTPSAVGDIPDFANGTTSSLNLTGGSATGGVVVWANCTGVKAAANNNANFWVHTN